MVSSYIRDQRNYDILITLTGFTYLTDYPTQVKGLEYQLLATVLIPARIKFPDWPERIASSPFWKSSIEKRWVMIGEEIEARLNQRRHLVPGFQHLTTVKYL